MSFNISDLNKRITIQRQIKTATDDMGGFTVEWTDLPNMPIWAAIWPQSAKSIMSEKTQDKQTVSEITHRIRIRFRRGVNAQNRIKYHTRYFNIIGRPINPDEDNEWLDFLCKEVG